MKIKEKLLALLQKMRGEGALAVRYEQQVRVGLCKRGETREEAEGEETAEKWRGFRMTIPVFDLVAVFGAFYLLCKLFRRK